MRKTFSLETVTFNDKGKKKNMMVFTAFDESKQKFIEMLIEPQTIVTRTNGLKTIKGSINEITKYE